jgi:hypothetical protein
MHLAIDSKKSHLAILPRVHSPRSMGIKDQTEIAVIPGTRIKSSAL